MVRKIVIAVGLVVAACAGGTHLVSSLLKPSDKTVVVPADVLAGVSASDAKLLRDFYAAVADIVVRDGSAADPVCKTMFDLRNRHKQALQMAFVNTGMVGKYQGLGDRLDAYLLKAVGELDVPLTPENRQAAAAAFLKIR